MNKITSEHIDVLEDMVENKDKEIERLTDLNKAKGALIKSQAKKIGQLLKEVELRNGIMNRQKEALERLRKDTENTKLTCDRLQEKYKGEKIKNERLRKEKEWLIAAYAELSIGSINKEDKLWVINRMQQALKEG
jgi:hypothetical protein